MSKLDFKIAVGQSAVGGIPIGPPIITFINNEKFLQVRLEDLKNWINSIWESQGNRAPEAYKAKDQLESLFIEIIHMITNP